MNNNRACPSFPLEDLLNNDCDLHQQVAFEQHVENCLACQQRLADMAAGGQWWTRATTHLSTIDELELPPGTRSWLSDSSRFVVPTIDEPAIPRNSADRHGQIGSTNGRESDWTRILDAPTHPEMLGRIDQFEIESLLGQGGMGIVLKGFDRQLNRAVAIKVLSPHLASNGTSRKRFEREAQAAAAVVHPNVIPIYAVKACETRPYIVMQLVSGHSLQSLVHEKGPLDVKDIVRVAIQVAAGLEEAHELGLIHRDIKPGNVLIEQDVSRVVITDFGLARAADDAGITQTGWIAGTPHYMSPEQARGESLDCRTDLFSLGGLMYYLATGREPFRAESPFAVIQKIINDRPTSPLELNSDLPPLISDIIEKLLEKEPKDRFQSAAEVQDLLKRYLSHLQQPARVAKPKRVLTRRKRRLRNVFIGATIAALSGVSCFVAWHWIFEGTTVRQPPAGDARLPVSGPTAGSTFTSTSENSEPGLTPFFSDGRLESEIMAIDRELESLERSLRQTSPMDQSPMDPSGHSESARSPSQFSVDVDNLRAQAVWFERVENKTSEALKAMLGLPSTVEQDSNPKPQTPEKK